MARCVYTVLFAFVLLGALADAAKILGLFPFPSKSHVVAYQPLFDELARRGHEVTVVSAFPKNKQIPNYKEIIYEDTFPRGTDNFNFFRMRNIPFFILMFFMKGMVVNSCEKFLAQPNIQNFIHGTDEFDLVIYEPFMTQCSYGFLHKFKAPTIQMIPNTLLGWNADSVGNPSSLSYVPNLHSNGEDNSFFSRVRNFALVSYMQFFRAWIIEPTMDSIMRKYFPDPSIPSISELEKNASLLYLHSHPILNHPRPFTPNTIEVAGLHIKTTGELPQDLKKFLDDAPHGVIYFSLGSNVRGVDMPDEMRDAILKSFSKLKEKVLWKWEADTMEGQPKNVRLGKWLPQHDILKHPNVKLFITHGGLMSLQEATFFGVPLIVMPVGADQKFNADVAQNRGLGVVLDVQTITEESLDNALHEVLQESRYREAAKQLSSIFQDQPQKPLERAVYWAEYIIRHKGALHMRSAALKLNFVQYYLLDVIAVISLAVFTSVYVVVVLSRLIVRRLCSKSAKHSKSKHSEKKKN